MVELFCGNVSLGKILGLGGLTESSPGSTVAGLIDRRRAARIASRKQRKLTLLSHCEACGTMTDNRLCDCTRARTGTQRLVPFSVTDLRRTVAAERASERERCAKIAEQLAKGQALEVGGKTLLLGSMTTGECVAQEATATAIATAIRQS